MALNYPRIVAFAKAKASPIHESTSPPLQILLEECPQLDISSQPHPCRDGKNHSRDHICKP